MPRNGSILKRGVVTALVAAGALALTTVSAAAAEGKPGHTHDHDAHEHGASKDRNMPGGMPGKPSDVSRTVTVIADDTKYDRKTIEVKSGETVRFAVRNKGTLVHEFTIGTHEMQKEHQVEMMKMMDSGKLTATEVVGGMEHSHGNSLLLEPGEEGELVWKFQESGTLEFACNIPGHYEQGMHGDFEFKGNA